MVINLYFNWFRSPGSFRDDSDFQEGLRLEAVDVYNPRVLRVANVVAVEVSYFIICVL